MINFAFLTLIFVLGIFVAIEDVRHKKIKNKFIVAGLAIGLLLFFGFWLRQNLSLVYLQDVFINTAIAALVAFLLWELGIWPAGDAKLFILFTFLLPLEFYSNGYLAFFPALVFLTNCFVAFLIFLLIESCIMLGIKLASGIKRRGASRQIRLIGEGMSQKLKDKFSEKKNLSKKLLKNFFVISAYMILGRLYLHRSFNFLTFLKYTVIFWLAYSIIFYYLENFTQKKMAASELEEKMNLTDPTVRRIKKIPGLFHQLGSMCPEGLTREQVEILSEFDRKNPLGSLYIYRTVPFAPWIIAGLIITLLLRTNILRLIF